MKKIFAFVFMLAAAFVFTAAAYAEKDSGKEEFFSYLTECAASYEKEIDITDYVLGNGWSLSEVGEIMKQYYLSEPMLFFVKKEMQIRYNNSETYFQVDFSYLYTEKQTEKMRKEMRRAALKATDGITEDMSDAEKALVVHDYIITNCAYDHSHEGYSAYDCLVNKKCVCQGYTLAYIYVMRDILGIDCSAVLSDSENHSWNYLKIDDEWYHVDLTADDPAFYTFSGSPYDGFAAVQHKNFLLNDKQCKKSSELHRKWTTLGLPESDSTDFEGLFCEKSASPVYKIDGLWYYVMMDPDSPGANYKKTGDKSIYTLVCSFDPLTGENETVKRVKSNWYLYRNKTTGEKLKKSSWYVDSYAKLAMVDGQLYYSTADAVYRLNTETGKAKKVYTLKKKNCDIFGIAASGETKLRICYKKDNSYKGSFLKLSLS